MVVVLFVTGFVVTREIHEVASGQSCSIGTGILANNSQLLRINTLASTSLYAPRLPPNEHIQSGYSWSFVEPLGFGYALLCRRTPLEIDFPMAQAGSITVAPVPSSSFSSARSPPLPDFVFICAAQLL